MWMNTGGETEQEKKVENWQSSHDHHPFHNAQESKESHSMSHDHVSYVHPAHLPSNRWYLKEAQCIRRVQVRRKEQDNRACENSSTVWIFVDFQSQSGWSRAAVVGISFLRCYSLSRLNIRFRCWSQYRSTRHRRSILFSFFSLGYHLSSNAARHQGKISKDWTNQTKASSSFPSELRLWVEAINSRVRVNKTSNQAEPQYWKNIFSDTSDIGFYLIRQNIFFFATSYWEWKAEKRRHTILVKEINIKILANMSD